MARRTAREIRRFRMVILEGQGTISVTEPGRDKGTYWEDVDIIVYGEIVHFIAHEKHHTAAATMCLIGWNAPPKIKVTDGG
jgi:hypothetical protein